MKMSTPFPGRRRKAEGRHEMTESKAERAREYRDETPKRQTLTLKKKRGR